MNTILIFAGAGASKAVSPNNYPTTVEFLQGLTDNIREHPLYKAVETFLLGSQEDKTLDIELILWRLQELQTFCQTVGDVTQFPGWMLTTGNFSNALKRPSENVGHLHSLSQGAISELDSLIGQINQTVYDLYSTLPTSEELSTTWSPLLEGLKQLDVKTEIVTTNYDMVIESALDPIPVADTAWRGSVVRTLDVNLWNQSQSNTGLGLLTKLHGSVNWSKKGDKIFVGDPNFKGSHKNHAIIYPGFKGRPADAYFLSFHEHFRRSMQTARAIVFIGFAFRDQYINDICANTITNDKTVVSINTQEIKLPFTVTESHHIVGSFDNNAVTSCLKHVRNALNS